MWLSSWETVSDNYIFINGFEGVSDCDLCFEVTHLEHVAALQRELFGRVISI